MHCKLAASKRRFFQLKRYVIMLLSLAKRLLVGQNCVQRNFLKLCLTFASSQKMSYIVVVEIYIHNYDNNGLLHSYTHTLGSRADHVELRKKGCESLTTTPGRFGSIIYLYV